MDLERPLAVVTPTADGDALAVLARADRAFTAAQVRELAGRRSVEGMRLALKRLVAQGIVTTTRVGATTAYSLNRDHLAAPSVIAMADLKRELIERLRDRLGRWSPSCTYAALFGSAARGDMHLSSDLDLLIVRPSLLDPDEEGWAAQVDGLRAEATRWTGNDVRVLELDEDDLSSSQVSPVLQEVRREGIRLFGSPTHLHDVLRTGTA